ncbi:leukocyte surface antigen CD53-like [Hypanus sabinus]|uniref:leukocyte surface antigen CD53-like n=1 Tax=Hypanus sabinus TaxID=79690 RepID=UPI0028C469C3|nr:leukocyte surface antigen CD53-like [Hypanus sabinus]XP_059828715.1 leukocyte surface antigen CD53-like [Hypanus sabinus]
MAFGCLKTLKYMLFAFNLLFWICGCVIMGLGIYMLNMQMVSLLFSSVPSLSVANILIIVGCITMVVAFLGCTGSIKENKCLLLSFFIILLLILLFEVMAAIILFVYEAQIDRHIEEDMKKALDKLQTSNNTELWDKIQGNLKCCGVVNSSDWGNNIPKSCCANQSCNSENYFSKGCYDLVREWFESNFLVVGIAVICASIIQVLGMSFAMTLYCHICNNYKSYGD